MTPVDCAERLAIRCLDRSCARECPFGDSDPDVDPTPTDPRRLRDRIAELRPDERWMHVYGD